MITSLKHMFMARLFYISIMILAVWACSSGKNATKTSATVTKSSQDSTEYEIIIIDPAFDQWYITNYTPAKDYPLEYYRGRNIIGVANWNEYYRSGRYTRTILNEIDYQPNIDYGIEVNRKLFWYFRYIEETERIRVLW